MVTRSFGHPNASEEEADAMLLPVGIFATPGMSVRVAPRQLWAEPCGGCLDGLALPLCEGYGGNDEKPR